MCSTALTVATKCHTQIISLSNYLCMKRVYMYNHVQIYFFHFSIWKKAFYVLLLDVMVNMFISKHETYFFKHFFNPYFHILNICMVTYFGFNLFLLQHWQMQTHTKLGTIYKPALKDVGQLLGSRLYIYSPNNIWNAHCW